MGNSIILTSDNFFVLLIIWNVKIQIKLNTKKDKYNIKIYYTYIYMYLITYNLC